MRAIILAGGFGTRLKSVVPDLPKPMAKIAGRPFLEYVMDRLIFSGVTEIILSVGYRSSVIMEHFADEYRGITISYAVETDPLGTGGAIANALQDRGDEPALVINGDTLLDLDYEELIAWYKSMPTKIAMVLKVVPDVSRYGSVLLSDGRVTGFQEKGQRGSGLINAGVYIIHPGVFAQFNLFGRFAFESDLLQMHCEELSPRAFVTDAYFIDIGIPEDFKRAQIELPNIL